jgi:DNA replication licensing factor MCM5
LEVDLAHVNDYDPLLQQHLQTTPATYIQMLEEAAQEVVSQLVVEGAEEEDWAGDTKPNISVYLTSSQNGVPLRSITALEMNKLLKVPGIVIGASRIRAKATTITIRCRQCAATKVLSVPSAFGGVAIPRFCDTETAPGEVACPQDPYVVIADQSTFMDQQTLKLQETPEDVPTGEMPRVFGSLTLTLAQTLAQTLTLTLTLNLTLKPYPYPKPLPPPSHPNRSTSCFRWNAIW